jgi:ubiquinone/menaquinone biosynthesis C-methylase UbiE
MTTNSPYIEETAFGNWFLRTKTWKFSVVRSALDDLSRMLPADMGRYPKVIDIGCGFGHSFAELSRRFSPDLIVGMDADPDMQAHARAAAEACATQVRLHRANAAHIDLPSDEFDLVLCHQTYHHIVEQEAAMAEFFRILKPGGFLLFAESTRRFIHSLPIKLLFRHPMDVQRTAEEYLAMIRAAGFELSPERVSMPYLWWSRPDLGLLELLGLPVARQREETLVNAVARKPLL